jgi:hypothetical protein
VTEPDVVITDYLLALECALFVWLLSRRNPTDRAIRSSIALFFAATAVAATAGGTVHGFFLDASSRTGQLLWRIALLALGFTAFSLWSLFALLLFSPKVSNAIRVVAGIELVAYAVLVLTASRSFRVAIADYVPAALAVFVAFLLVYIRGRDATLLAGAAGIALALVASYLQQLHVGIHPVYFNHNALYHLLQAVALLLVFCTARRITGSSIPSKR